MLSDPNVQIAVVWTGLAVAFGFGLGVLVTRWWRRGPQFTREDAAMLRLVERTTTPTLYSLDGKNHAPLTLNAALLALASRIEALLPPEETP